MAFPRPTGTRVVHSSRNALLIIDRRLIVALMMVALPSAPAHAQWWTASPADYEDCAERIDKSLLAGDARATAIAECESRFAGRRKRGGGYTLHDFMQNRSFDIAGPNPTAAEQRGIDEHYAAFLNEQRRNIILTAFVKRQSEGQQAAVLPDFRDNPPAPQVAAKETPVMLPRPRPKLRDTGIDCAAEPLACGWAKVSSGLKGLKDSLFGPPTQPKIKRT